MSLGQWRGKFFLNIIPSDNSVAWLGVSLLPLPSGPLPETLRLASLLSCQQPLRPSACPSPLSTHLQALGILSSLHTHQATSCLKGLHGWLPLLEHCPLATVVAHPFTFLQSFPKESFLWWSLSWLSHLILLTVLDTFLQTLECFRPALFSLFSSCYHLFFYNIYFYDYLWMILIEIRIYWVRFIA